MYVQSGTTLDAKAMTLAKIVASLSNLELVSLQTSILAMTELS